MKSVEHPESLPRNIGPYRLQEALGRGGMGVVYGGWDTRLERPVALKRLLCDRTSAADRRRFLGEARATARLSHPNIVRVHDFLSSDDDEWMVMERIEGTSLDALVRCQGPLPMAQVQELALQLAEALAAAHREGILHRDLKLSNVILADGGHVKVLDFGLARRLGPVDQSLSSLWLSASHRGTSELRLVGTPHAMAPEQARGETLGFPTDLFALGILLYELATGVAPFKAATLAETLTRVCSAEPEPAHRVHPQVPETFSALLSFLMEKESARRPPSAAAVCSLLRQPSMLIDLVEERAPKLNESFVEQMTLVEDSIAGAVDSAGEYRQVTVVCLEPISTAEGGADLTDIYERMAEVESLVLRVSRSLDGHLVSRFAQRLTLVFGYPSAREDDARRAVRAALAIDNELARALDGATTPGRRWSLRGGIQTGPALVLGQTTERQLVLGATSDQANRIRRSAAAGQILVSDATARLVGREFSIHGVDDDSGRPVEQLKHGATYRVVPRDETSGSWATAGRYDGPLVSRREELATLEARRASTSEGPGRVVLVSGDAGIGKTRLLDAFFETLQSSEGVRRANCSPQARNSALRPVEDLVVQLLGLKTRDEEHGTLENLSRRLASLGLGESPNPELLASFLGWPLDDSARRPEMSPEAARRRQLDLLVSVVNACSHERQLIVVFEDLHWADPSTLEWLTLLTGRLAESRVLMLLTARRMPSLPDEQALSSWTHLPLGPLLETEVGVLIDHLAEGKSFPDEVRQLVIRRSDGVPLFVEELLRNLVESKQLVDTGESWQLTGQLEELRIPSTLHDLLAERLDRLGNTKKVAQLAAVMGREPTYELLLAVAGDAIRDLDAHLNRLVHAGILYRKGYSRQARFKFRHALIRDVAFGSLVPEHRRELHGVIAAVLSERFPDVVQRRPEFVAFHLEGAGKDFQAAEFLQRAGARAAKTSAYWEAVSLLRKGLDLVEGLEESGPRQDLMQSLYVQLAVPTAATAGFSEQTTADVYRRAGISGAPDDTAAVDIDALYLEWSVCFMRGEVEATDDVLARMQCLAETSKKVRTHFISQSCHGLTLFFRGEVEACLEPLIQGIGSLQVDSGRLSENFATDPRFNAQVVLAWCKAIQGMQVEAQDLIDGATAYANHLQDPFHVVTVKCYQIKLYLYQTDRFEVIEELAGEIREAAAEHGVSHYVASGKMYGGWARMMRGDAGGKRPFLEGVEASRAMNVHCYDFFVEVLHAQGLLALGDYDAAADIVNRALAWQPARIMRGQLAEALRIRAATWVHRGQLGAAERDLRRAMTVAAGCRAHLFEYRAALALAKIQPSARPELAHVRDRIHGLQSGDRQFDPGSVSPKTYEHSRRNLVIHAG